MAVTDDFNRADAATLGANWTDVQLGSGSETWRIVSNRCSQTVSASGDQAVRYSGTTFANAQYAQVVLATTNVGTFVRVGPAVRCQSGAASYYAFRVRTDASDIEIVRVSAGAAAVVLASSATAVALNDVLRLEANRSTLTAKINGVVVLTVNDTNFTSGWAGIAGRNVDTGNALDSFEGGDIVGNTYTVKPSGGHYTSLSAWEAARQGDLTGLGPEIVECSGNLSDTTQVTVDGWTTTAADYIQIITPQADRHAGVWDTAKYRLEVNSAFNHAMRIMESFVRVEGLQVRQTGTTADHYGAIYFTGTDAAAVTRFDACLVRSAGTHATAARGLWLGGRGTHTVRNCIIYDVVRDSLIADMGAADSATFDNCTVIGGGYGIVTGGGGEVVTVRNCYAHGTTDAYTGTMTRSNCAHSSATVFTGSTASVARSTANFRNVTAGSENYHLIGFASATLLTGGVSLSGDFTTDIDGQTRVDWSIGADEAIGLVFGEPVGHPFNSSSFTRAFTVPSGCQLLLAIVAQDQTSGAVGTVDWNTTERLTLFDTQVNGRTISVWSRVNPTAGSFNLTGASFTAIHSSLLIVAVMGNVNQTTSLAGVQKENATNTGPTSLTVTSVAGNLIVSAAAWNDIEGYTSNETELLEVLAPTNELTLGVGYETSLGTNTAVGWSAWVSNVVWSHIAFAIQAAPDNPWHAYAQMQHPGVQ